MFIKSTRIPNIVSFDMRMVVFFFFFFNIIGVNAFIFFELKYFQLPIIGIKLCSNSL